MPSQARKAPDFRAGYGPWPPWTQKQAAFPPRLQAGQIPPAPGANLLARPAWFRRLCFGGRPAPIRRFREQESAPFALKRRRTEGRAPVRIRASPCRRQQPGETDRQGPFPPRVGAMGDRLRPPGGDLRKTVASADINPAPGNHRQVDPAPGEGFDFSARPCSCWRNPSCSAVSVCARAQQSAGPTQADLATAKGHGCAPDAHPGPAVC